MMKVGIIEGGRVLARWENGKRWVEARIADDGTYAWSSYIKGSGKTGLRTAAECIMRAALEAACMPGRELRRVLPKGDRNEDIVSPAQQDRVSDCTGPRVTAVAPSVN